MREILPGIKGHVRKKEQGVKKPAGLKEHCVLGEVECVEMGQYVGRDRRRAYLVNGFGLYLPKWS